jgi:hypothetical protein
MNEQFIDRVIGVLLEMRLNEGKVQTANKKTRDNIEGEAAFSREDLNKPLKPKEDEREITPEERANTGGGPEGLRRNRARQAGRSGGPMHRFIPAHKIPRVSDRPKRRLP